MTSFNLPKHHAMNRYFREQAANMEVLIENTSEEKLASWRERYNHKKLRPDEIQSLADEHEAVLTAAKSFSLSRGHTKGSKAMPSREKHTLVGYFMEPVRFGHGWPNEEHKSYTEEGLYLRLNKAEFSPKKVIVGIGAGGMALTKHMLERVYERTEVDHEEFADLLHGHMDEAFKALALAEAANFWIERPNARVTAIPYAEGLLIVNTRVLFGKISDGDFGFRMEFPRLKLTDPYINDHFLLPADPSFSKSGMRASQAYFGTTYVNLTTLNDAQLDYYYAFRGLLDDVGDGPVAALAYMTFAPQLPHEKSGSYSLHPQFEPKRRRIQGMLQEGWLKPNETPPFAMLLPFEPGG